MWGRGAGGVGWGRGGVCGGLGEGLGWGLVGLGWGRGYQSMAVWKSLRHHRVLLKSEVSLHCVNISDSHERKKGIKKRKKGAH